MKIAYPLPTEPFFAMRMLGATPDGDAYTFAEIDGMLRDAGFGAGEARSLAPAHQQLILARNDQGMPGFKTRSRFHGAACCAQIDREPRSRGSSPAINIQTPDKAGSGVFVSQGRPTSYETS